MNFCHIIYAVRSKYVKNTIRDLKQRLLPNIFRTLLGDWNLLRQIGFSRIHNACEEREKKNKQDATIRCSLSSLCPSSGEQRPCVTACGVLLWFCWMWLVAVVGRCVVGCEHCNDARNMLRQKLIINIWFLHLVGFFSLFTLCSRCTVTGT